MGPQPANVIDGRSASVLDARQKAQLEAFAATLTPAQALWVSSYFGAIGSQARPAGPGSDRGVEAGPGITVLFGTETGNARSIAEQLAARLAAQGLAVRAIDMADYKPKTLRDERYLVVIAATHGEGNPPDPAKGFFEFLWRRKAPTLTSTKFAVLSLGDSSYVHFCKAGRDLDARLEALGAERLTDRIDCDVDFEEAVKAWIDTISGLLESAVDLIVAPLSTAVAPQAASVPSGPDMAGRMPGPDVAHGPDYSRGNPFAAEILDSVRLNGRHSDKETRHIELSLDGSGLAFEPGDSIGVVPENEDRTVRRVLDLIRFSEIETVRIGDAEKPLGDALKHDLELTMLTPKFLEAYAEAVDADQLRALLVEDRRPALRHFMEEHQVSDVLDAFPPTGLSAQTFVGMLRKMQPRLYSIASSQVAQPDEVHLTVGVTRRTRGGKARNGVASTFLAERRALGEQVPIYVHRNKTFRLPSDPDAPVIMVGPGTGVAPFRAFLQQREETGAAGRTWLFFGDRTMRDDFLYQTEWQRQMKDGILTRMDVAFSRDQDHKHYVQDRICANAKDVFQWLEEGAYFYVCGDAENMAPAVDSALMDVIKEEGNLTARQAQAYLKSMQQERRYQRDVY